jgi:GMP synthase (glutamine-hydrolysing)
MVLIISCGGSKSPNILDKVRKLGVDAELVHIDSLSEPISSQYTHIIVGGAPILLTEVDPKPYLFKFHFLSTTTVPVLGICFGHQILGMLHGSTVSKCTEDRDWQQISIVAQSKLFDKIESQQRFKEDHCESISCPEGFQVIASSGICDVEAMQHNDKNLYGVQFHPEVSGEAGEKLFHNFLTYF